MKVLYLLRHGKSSWADPTLADIDRPLAARGVRALRRMRKYLRQQAIAPDLVACSPALRARQTLDQIEGAIGRDTPVRVEPALYSTTATEIARLVSKSPESVSSLMLIGHNPALQDLAVLLAEEGEEALLARLVEKFPTGALAVVTIPHRSWRQLRQGGGRLEGLVIPRDLA